MWNWRSESQVWAGVPTQGLMGMAHSLCIWPTATFILYQTSHQSVSGCGNVPMWWGEEGGLLISLIFFLLERDYVVLS